MLTRAAPPVQTSVTQIRYSTICVWTFGYELHRRRRFKHPLHRIFKSRRTYASRDRLEAGILGRVAITEGDLVFFGSKYEVTSGNITFYNPVRIEPVLNVTLKTQAKGVNVVLTVTGPSTT